MQDIKVMTIPSPCCKKIFGSQEWPNKWDKSSRPVDAASNYEASTPRAPLCLIVATTPLDLLHVDFTTIETTMELDQSPRVANVLVFQDHFTKYVLAYVTPIKLWKPLLNFCMEAISLSLEPWPGSWVTEVLVLPAALFRNCVRS